jgi:hypothetical protein
MSQKNFVENLTSVAFGYAIGLPSSIDRKNLKFVKDNSKLIKDFASNRGDYAKFKVSKESFKTGIKQLEPIPDIKSFKLSSSIEKTIFESIQLYAQRYYRWSYLAAASVVENILRGQMQGSDFNSIITAAEKEQLISKSDFHFLHAIRIDRNGFIHDLSKTPSIGDAKTMLCVVFNLLPKISIVKLKTARNQMPKINHGNIESEVAKLETLIASLNYRNTPSSSLQDLMCKYINSVNSRNDDSEAKKYLKDPEFHFKKLHEKLYLVLSTFESVYNKVGNMQDHILKSKLKKRLSRIFEYDFEGIMSIRLRKSKFKNELKEDFISMLFEKLERWEADLIA